MLENNKINDPVSEKIPTEKKIGSTMLLLSIYISFFIIASFINCLISSRLIYNAGLFGEKYSASVTITLMYTLGEIPSSIIAYYLIGKISKMNVKNLSLRRNVAVIIMIISIFLMIAQKSNPYFFLFIFLPFYSNLAITAISLFFIISYAFRNTKSNAITTEETEKEHTANQSDMPEMFHKCYSLNEDDK